jgi:hypothetical protein
MLFVCFMGEIGREGVVHALDVFAGYRAAQANVRLVVRPRLSFLGSTWRRAHNLTLDLIGHPNPIVVMSLDELVDIHSLYPPSPRTLLVRLVHRVVVSRLHLSAWSGVMP